MTRNEALNLALAFLIGGVSALSLRGSLDDAADKERFKSVRECRTVREIYHPDGSLWTVLGRCKEGFKIAFPGNKTITVGTILPIPVLAKALSELAESEGLGEVGTVVKLAGGEK